MDNALNQIKYQIFQILKLTVNYQPILKIAFKCKSMTELYLQYLNSFKMDQSTISNKFIQLINYIRNQNLPEVRRLLNQTSTEIANRLQMQSRQPPIFFAALISNQQIALQILKLLLSKNANPYFKDTNQQTVLFYIARDGKNILLEYLLTNFKFNLNEIDFSQQTPIFYAAVQNRAQSAQILINHGANVNHKDKNNQTCLFYSARQGHFETCKILIQNGVQIFHQDNSKHNAVYFARKNNRKNVVDLLNIYKQDQKKSREIEKIKQKQSSLQEKKKQKKEVVKNDYCLIFTDQSGNVHELDEYEIEQFRKHHEKLFNLMLNPEGLENETYPQQKKFEKTANKILSHFWKLPHGYLFHEPVDYIKLNILDYPNIVKRPMDFGTIKIKLQNNAYQNHQRFVEDMLLVFDNCILYNGSQNDVGRIGLNMKLEFNGMCKQFYNALLI